MPVKNGLLRHFHVVISALVIRLLQPFRPAGIYATMCYLPRLAQKYSTRWKRGGQSHGTANTESSGPSGQQYSLARDESSIFHYAAALSAGEAVEVLRASVRLCISF